MFAAWRVLLLAVLLLFAAERWGKPAWLSAHFRSTQFLTQTPKMLPTPWPTPPALPATPGQIHTYPGAVRRLLQKGAPGRVPGYRVAYFADSISEGDLICSTLRASLQQRFGGSGVGWVGMAPIDAWARDNIQQSFSPDWDRRSIFKAGWEGQAFGPGGSVWHLSKSPGQVAFKGLRGLADLARLAPATLWYGPLGPGGAEVEISADGLKRTEHLDGLAPLNHVALSRAPLASLQLDIQAGPEQPFYGVSFDQGSGLDNFSSRGSHGGPLQRLDLGMLRQLQVERGYRLVLVQYGINALVIRSDPQYKWYRHELAAGLRQLQAGLPGAAMVLVSATDRAVNENGTWVSDPFLPGLLAAQAAAASDVGIPFINAFDLMGGPGTMKAWADGKPRLAEHDYTHLSPLGAKRFGALLWDALEHLGQAKTESKP